MRQSWTTGVAAGLLLGAILLGGCGGEEESNVETTEVASGTTEAVGVTETTEVETPSSTATTAAASGSWVERTDIEPPAEATLVAVSDTAAVYVTEAALEVYLFAEERWVEVPGVEAAPFAPAIDGDLLVWYEADYEGPTPEHLGLYAYRLPDGPATLVVEPGRPAEAPGVAGNRVSWVEGRRRADPNPEEVWELPIYGVQVDGAGAPTGEPELLVDAPTAIFLGDSGWNYDLSGAYLAFEVHEATPEHEAGLHVLDLATGEETFLGEDRWAPSLSGDLLVYDHTYRSNLTLEDLATGEERLLDPEGYLGSVEPAFVAYVVGPTGDAWQVVVAGLDGADREVLGTQDMPLQSFSSIVTSEGYVGFTDPEGLPHLFEWRPGSAD